jgi:plastocyanin
VAIACTASDAESGLADPADAGFSLWTSVPDGTATTDATTDARSVCDVVGNCTAAGPVGGILVDRAVPTIVASVAPDPGPSGWSTVPLTVAFTCADEGSGVASCPAEQVVSADGAHQVTGTATDVAGNTAATTVDVGIDGTPPTVSVGGVSDGATYTLGGVPPAACLTTDYLSGVAEWASLQVTGGELDGTGTFTATCSGASDLAGNQAAPVSATYTVQGISVWVSAKDSGFSPKTITVDLGTTVGWTIDGAASQTVTDGSGLGLFDSGTLAPGATYQFMFFAAGTYPYRDLLHTRLKGTVVVPVVLSPSSGAVDSSFQVTWSSQPAPAGYVYEIDVQRPGSTRFAPWTYGTTLESGSFVPDAGPGTYSFRARLRHVASRKAGPFSPTGSISVG